MAVYQGEAGVKKARQNLISLSQLADGDRIASCLDKIEKLAASDGYDAELFRKKSDKIKVQDLDSNVLDMIQSCYDDTPMKNRIGRIETVLGEKADKCDLSLYRKETQLITRYDLDDDLIKMIKSGDYDYIYDDTELRKRIESLQLCKTETSESGFISELTPSFDEVVTDVYERTTIINCLNFLFGFVNYYRSLDYGLITQEADEECLDYGLITQEIDGTYEYGTLYAQNNVIQDTLNE